MVAGVTLIGAFALGGCASVYQVKVEAIDRSAALNQPRLSYRIRDLNAPPAADSLRRREIAEHLKTALSAKGFYEAPDAESADMIVEVSYGIGPPRVQVTQHEQLSFGQPGNNHVGATPQGVMREMMGYTEVSSAVVLHEKHMSICARENSRGSDAEAQDIWRVHVTIENESQDLRGHLPILASAAMDHIGRNTEGATALTLRGDDEAIRFIRKGL